MAYFQLHVHSCALPFVGLTELWRIAMSNLKIVSFDPADYQLVPVGLTVEMREAAREQWHRIGTPDDAYLAMLAAIPDNLTGVVTHSGEPVAWCQRDTAIGWKGQLLNVANMFPSKFGLKDPLPLFTHPPAQPTHCLSCNRRLNQPSKNVNDPR
jgi:hypothetical protein